MKGFLIVILCVLSGCSSIKFTTLNPEPLPYIDIDPNTVDVAVVLGGGGAKGIAHLGVLYELEQAGIRPDLIVGCSSGSIIGSLYASDPNISWLTKVLMNINRKDLLDFSVMDSSFGVIKGVLLRSFLEKHLDVKTFEECQIPFIAVSTDLLTGDPVELGGGALIPAVYASSAIPGVFKPVKYLGRYLIDGGTVNPVPVSVAKKYGARIVIAVDIGESLSEKEPHHLFDIVHRSLQIAYRRLSDIVMQDADVVIRMKFHDIGLFDDSHKKELYEYGRSETLKYIPEIKKLID